MAQKTVHYLLSSEDSRNLGENEFGYLTKWTGPVTLFQNLYRR